MKLIVGLGNPDSKYQMTRHNIGFMVVDYYLNSINKEAKFKKDFKGNVYVDKDYIILKPMTYMNLSGESVRAVTNFYKIEPKDVLIISDDFNIPFLKLRLREKGSAGGHNGLKSIIEQLGTNEFKRVRFGLGTPEFDIVNFVLSKFTNDDLDKISKTCQKTNEIIKDFIDNKRFDVIMNKYNVDETAQ